MVDKVKKLAPVSLTNKQRKHLEKKSYKTNETISTIIRELIDKDIEEGKP